MTHTKEKNFNGNDFNKLLHMIRTERKGVKIFADTCFLLRGEYDFVRNLYSPMKSHNVLYPNNPVFIYITDSMYHELVKSSRSTDVSLAQRASFMLEIIDLELKAEDGVFKEYRNGIGGLFYDLDVLSISIQEKYYSSLIVLTQDRKLSRDLILVNSMESAGGNTIHVCYADNRSWHLEEGTIPGSVEKQELTVSEFAH
ncbi:MAG: hypothetical protein K6G19_06120 [Lachnospiraceae bacterium]|nr:hypothetical protein [Lachnospiraceae bacterium]